MLTALLSPGDSPATYQPTDAQVSQIMASRAYLRSGVPFERGSWFQALDSARRLRIADLAAGIERRVMAHAHDHADGGRHRHAEAHHLDTENARGRPSDGDDPHIWLAPSLLEVQARTVAGVLGELAPEHGELFASRLATLVQELRQLDQELRVLLSPLEGKAFFVFHPAWGYFADAYGLRQIAVEIEGQQPSDSELTELQELARAEGVTTIFVQPQIAGAAAAAVAQAIGGRLIVLDPLEPEVPANLRRVAAEILRAHGATADEPRQVL